METLPGFGEEMETIAADIKAMQKEIKAMKEYQDVMFGSTLKTGLGQLRYDLLKKLQAHPELEHVKPKQGLSDFTKPHDYTSEEHTRLDSLGKSWHRTSQSQPYEDYLAKRGLLEDLSRYYSFIQDSQLFGLSYEIVPEEYCKVFAYSVMRGREQNEPKCTNIYDEYGKACEFTYGKTFVEVAEAARRNQTSIKRSSFTSATSSKSEAIEQNDS